MKLWQIWCVFSIYASVGYAYSKYGRSCKDIGCLSNEVCVMETDPCSYYQRQNECGSYPTCKKNPNAAGPSCKNYVCPPTKVCKMDGATPKCVDDHSKVGRVGYDTSELKNEPAIGGSGGMYPQLPRGETTPRPNVGYQPPVGGQGYQGGQIGSGYPGRGNYPTQQGQGGYQQQPYPGYNGYGGYQNQGGHQNQGGYAGYPNNNPYYNQQYPGYQGGYNNNPYAQRGRPGSSGASGGISQSITDALKKYGLFYMILACYYQRILGF